MQKLHFWSTNCSSRSQHSAMIKWSTWSGSTLLIILSNFCFIDKAIIWFLYSTNSESIFFFLQWFFFEYWSSSDNRLFFQTCLGNAFWISVLTVVVQVRLLAWNQSLLRRIPSAYGQSRWCQVKTPSIPMTITITTRSDLLMSSGKTKISKTNFSFQILSCLLLKNKNESYLM